MFVAIIIFLVCLVGLGIFSDFAVKHSATLASMLGISNLVIGITLVSIGTDISEIFNSIIANFLGHGDINVGDSIGSNLTQMTLIFGLLPLICGGFKVKRKEFVIIGICEILALIIVFLVIEKGYFTRFDAFLMIITLIFYSIIIYSITKSDMLEKVNLMIENKDARQKKKRYHGFIAIISFIGVAICSYFLINAIIEISSYFNIQEYILSFLIVSIGTSMPELAVDISALRRKKYNIAIGDIMGSCIVDSTLSIGIGQLLFPQKIVSNIAIQTILVVMVIAIIVTIIISVRQKVDKKMGVLLIAIYFIAFFFILSL